MTIEFATEAQHRGSADLPFVEIGGGNKLKVIQVDVAEGLWIVENIFRPVIWCRRIDTPGRSTPTRCPGPGDTANTTTSTGPARSCSSRQLRAHARMRRG